MKNGYDNVSLFYDALAQLIFGNKLKDAQRSIIDVITTPAKVLIAGGGSGWILEELCRQVPSGLSITYVDASPKMVAMAGKRPTRGNQTTFIAAPVEKCELSTQFDYVLTPFLFDNFTQQHASVIFEKINRHLKSDGKWLNTDFQNTDKHHHKVLLNTMFLAFRVLCGISTNKLPDVGALFLSHDYSIKKENRTLSGFVTSVVHVKP